MSDMKNRNVSASKRRAHQRKLRNHRIAMTVALVLVVALASIGGTIAWLTATTSPVTNTFTTSDIGITLTETGTTNNAKSFKMVPGCTITKDPTVKVTAGSEKCYVFVKVDKSITLDTYIEYNVDSGWMQLKDSSNNDVSGVYYRIVESSASDQSFNVLTDNQVTVKNTVTKANMEALKVYDAVQPTLTFTAYASQYFKNSTDSFTPAEAWDNVKPGT